MSIDKEPSIISQKKENTEVINSQKIFQKKIEKILASLGNQGKALYKKLEEGQKLTPQEFSKLKKEAPEQFLEIITLLQKRKKFAKNLKNFLEKSSISFEKDPRSALQIRTIEKFINFLENGGNKGIIWHPTGTGKTRLIRILATQAGAKIMIQTPSLIVNQQLIDSLIENQLDHYDLKREDIAIYDSAHDPEAQPKNPKVLITTYNSTENHLFEFNPDIIISDETHRNFSHTRIDRMERFHQSKRKNFETNSNFDEDINHLLEKTIHISFSATPFIGKKNFRSLGYELIDMATLEDAIKGKLLCPIINDLQFLDLKYKILKEGDVGFRLEKEDDKILNKHFLKNYDNAREELQSLRGDKNYIPQGIDFCFSRKQAQDMANLRNKKELGIEEDVSLITSVEKLRKFYNTYQTYPFAFFLDGESSPALRDEIQKLYKEQKIHVLCGAEIFNEGLDLPIAEVANINPMGSWTDYIQRLGRILRIDSNNPEKRAYIYDYYFNPEKKCCSAANAFYAKYMSDTFKEKIKFDSYSLEKTIIDHYENLQGKPFVFQLTPIIQRGDPPQEADDIMEEEKKLSEVEKIAKLIETGDFDKHNFSGFDGKRFRISFPVPRQKNATQIVEFPSFEGLLDHTKVLRHYPKQFFECIKNTTTKHTLWNILNTLAKRQSDEEFSVKKLQENDPYEIDRLRYYLRILDRLEIAIAA